MCINPPLTRTTRHRKPTSSPSVRLGSQHRKPNQRYTGTRRATPHTLSTLELQQMESVHRTVRDLIHKPKPSHPKYKPTTTPDTSSPSELCLTESSIDRSRDLIQTNCQTIRQSHTTHETPVKSQTSPWSVRIEVGVYAGRLHRRGRWRCQSLKLTDPPKA